MERREQPFGHLAALFVYGHRLTGISEGDSDLDDFIAELVALHRAERLPFDPRISTYPLADTAARSTISQLGLSWRSRLGTLSRLKALQSAQ